MSAKRNAGALCVRAATAWGAGVDLDLRHLRYFAVLAETLHFGAASRRLGIEQPALSSAIKRLEQVVGVALLNRSSRHVSLTSAGSEFLRDALAVLDAASKAITNSRGYVNDEPAKLSLGLLVNTLFHALPTILTEFRRIHPHVLVEVFECSLDSQLAGLRNESLDFAFLRAPLMSECHDLEMIDVEPLPPCALAVPSGSSLACRSDITIDELTGEPIILFPYEESPDFVAAILKKFSACGHEPNVVIKGNTMFVLLSLVARGLGSAILTTMNPVLQPKGVTFVPIIGLDWQKDCKTVLAWRREQLCTIKKSFIKLTQRYAEQPTW